VREPERERERERSEEEGRKPKHKPNDEIMYLCLAERYFLCLKCMRLCMYVYISFFLLLLGWALAQSAKHNLSSFLPRKQTGVKISPSFRHGKTKVEKH
jgi:hypothetical protein